MIKKYKSFESGQILLPQNAGDDKPKIFDSGVEVSSGWRGTLKFLYTLQNNNIISVGNRVNSIISEGSYITVNHVDSGMSLISKDEPSTIFGVAGGREISIGGYTGVRVENDSLVINIKVDNSLFILSVKDNYDIRFIKPRVIISKEDPWGEEDWNED